MSQVLSKSSISNAESEATFEVLREEILSAKHILESLGIRVPAGSRLDNYERVLRKLEKYVTWAQVRASDRELIHDAVVECQQLIPSIATLAEEPQVKGWKPVALKAIGGNSSARSDGLSTPARDAQAELFVGSFARRGGYEVSFAEPDLIFRLPGEAAFGVAVKRVKSPKALKKRLREASEQIRRSEIPGVAAIDISYFDLPSSVEGIASSATKIRVDGMKSGMDNLRMDLKKYANGVRSDLIKQVDSEWCFGLLLFVTKPALVGEPMQLAVIVAIYICYLCDETDPHSLLLDRLSERLNASIWGISKPRQAE